MPLLRALLFVVTLALAAQAAAQGAAQRRLALVIGNNAYPGAPLLNPINDARAMAAALESTGFAVMLRTDATQREMLAAVREFGDRLKAAGGVGVFYFAGHGMQIKGRNYLIPVGAEIEREDEVAYQAIEAQAVLDKMESAGNGTNLMILDACRDNPFVRSFRSTQQGLAPMDAPVGTLVAFATAPGLKAADGQGRNGLYTSHLLAGMRQPGLKVEDLFKQVRSAVRRESQGRQVPMEWSSLEGDFYFVPASAGPPAPAAAPVPDVQAAIDDALWETVKDSASSAEVFAYLNRFPLGRHAKSARERMAELTAPRPLALPQSTDPLDPLSPAQRLVHEAQTLAGSQQALDELARWGEVGTEARPPNPRRNPAGFAEGDRFRYLLTGANIRQHYLWRIDRIDADGSLWVNNGRQRLDALGQRQAGNDEFSGEWLDWKPPLPVAAAARRGAGHEESVSVSVQARDAAGQVTVYTLRGPLQTEADTLRTPGHVAGLAGMTAAIKVTVRLDGSSLRSDGVSRHVQWDHVYWYAVGRPILLAAETTEYGDSIAVRHLRHDLVAIDALLAPPRLAGSAP